MRRKPAPHGDGVAAVAMVQHTRGISCAVSAQSPARPRLQRFSDKNIRVASARGKASRRLTRSRGEKTHFPPAERGEGGGGGGGGGQKPSLIPQDFAYIRPSLSGVSIAFTSVARGKRERERGRERERERCTLEIDELLAYIPSTGVRVHEACRVFLFGSPRARQRRRLRRCRRNANRHKNTKDVPRSAYIIRRRCTRARLLHAFLALALSHDSLSIYLSRFREMKLFRT